MEVRIPWIRVFLLFVHLFILLEFVGNEFTGHEDDPGNQRDDGEAKRGATMEVRISLGPDVFAIVGL